MIIALEGILESVSTLVCVINVGGVSYEISVPLNTQLPSIGDRVKLRIYAVYREDSQTLFGFNTLEERNFFKLIVEKVSGVGPRTALGILSRFSLQEIQQSILLKDALSLSKIPGIGKKTAEKIILELSDKVTLGSTQELPLSVETSSAVVDAVLGLVALGYKKADAEQRIRTLIPALPQATADVLIKAAITVK